MHKTCNRCKVEKTVDQFSRCNAQRNGLRGYCKACETEIYHLNKDRIAAHQKEWRRQNRERIHAAEIEYRKTHRPKRQAKDAVRYALKMGRMTKQPCEVCGDTNADAHHDDYAKPLEVRWLCRTHHNQWHAENGEAKNGRIAA